MEALKTIIIEPHLLVRRIIAKTLRGYDDIVIAGMADDLATAEEMILTTSSDVVLLGIDSIRSPGNTILRRLALKMPNLPIVVITPKNKEGAEAAVNALRAGAADFITRPEHKNLVMFAERHFKKRIRPILKAVQKSPFDFNSDNSSLFDQITETAPTDLVVIGGGTGAVPALFTLLAALPKNLEAPIVAVQHMPRIYSAFLASKLDAISDLTVREARNGVTLTGGKVWLAAGGYQCKIENTEGLDTLTIAREPRKNSMRPSIDVLFQSAAEKYEKNVLAVILSGSDGDGFYGAKQIKEKGGQIVVQEPSSALAPELPANVIKQKWAGGAYLPEVLADQILKRTSRIPSSQIVHNGHDDTTLGDDRILR